MEPLVVLFWFGVFAVGKEELVDRQERAKSSEILDQVGGALIMLMEAVLNTRRANWNGATRYSQPPQGRLSAVLEEAPLQWGGAEAPVDHPGIAANDLRYVGRPRHPIHFRP